MPIEYRDSLRERHAWMVRQEIECQGRGIERPDIENPFCNTVSSWDIEYFIVDDNGNRVGEKKTARVCSSHLKRLVRIQRIELVSEPTRKPRPSEDEQ